MCNDSSFHYRSAPAHASDWDKTPPSNDEHLRHEALTEVTFAFYEEFWDMQKYFMDISELAVSGNAPRTKTVEIIISQRLKKIEETLKEVY